MREINKDLSVSPARNRITWLFAGTRPASAHLLIALIAAVAVPLAFNPWGYNAFELPKAIILRSLALLAVLAALRQALAGNRPQVGRAILPPLPLLWPTLAFGTALILATATSVDPHLSLWGSYERQQGLLTHGALLVLFLAVANSLRSAKQLRWLWTVLVWGSVPALIYGLVQALGWDPLDWQTDAASPVLSTLGRSNFLGAYLVEVLPLTVGLALVSARRWPYLLLISGQMLCLILTKARGAWLGLAVTTLAFTLIWWLAFRDRRPLLLSLAAAGLLASSLFLVSVPSGWLDSIQGLPVISDLASLTDTSTGSTAARITIWQASWPLVGNRPWLGYGPDTMRLVFAPVFPPQLVYYLGRHVSVDRTHNLELDLAIGTGFLGVVGFGAILIAFGRLVWRGLRRNGNRLTKVAWIAISTAILGHLLDLQVSFDSVATATVFWLTIALGVGLWRSQEGPERDPAGLPANRFRKSTPRNAWGFTALALVAGTILGILAIQPLLADTLYRNSQDENYSLAARQAGAVQAVELWPLEPEYRLGLAWLEAQLGDFRAAEEQFTFADATRPNDPRIWAAWGEMYVQWGAIEPVRLRQSEAAYRRALELAPNLATYHTALGLVLALQGRAEEGVLELERAVQLDATDWIAYRHLVNLYLALGREEDALRAQHLATYWENRTEEN